MREAACHEKRFIVHINFIHAVSETSLVPSAFVDFVLKYMTNHHISSLYSRFIDKALLTAQYSRNYAFLIFIL